ALPTDTHPLPPFFLFTDSQPSRISTLSLHDALPISQRRARTLAIRWLITYARDRREKGMSDKLANEILDALNEQGGAFKKKDDRSEEHTSELQSRGHLVCRLLLEKKKTNTPESSIRK